MSTVDDSGDVGSSAPSRADRDERDRSPVHSEDEIAGIRIGEVARRTGSTTALLRAWEARHGVLTPSRTDGGQRLYSERDVDRVRRVQELIAQGWSISGAVARLRERGELTAAPGSADREADDRPRPGAGTGSRAVLLSPLDAVDPHAVRLALDTARAMLRSTTAEDVRDALVDLVVRCGGTVGPAAEQEDDVIPVDLAIGVGAPLLPRAAPASVARLRLEALLPGLVEDGRVLIHQLRLADRAVSRTV